MSFLSRLSVLLALFRTPPTIIRLTKEPKSDRITLESGETIALDRTLFSVLIECGDRVEMIGTDGQHENSLIRGDVRSIDVTPVINRARKVEGVEIRERVAQIRDLMGKEDDNPPHNLSALLDELDDLLVTLEGCIAPATARPLADWHEDQGPVLWWRFPIEEPPYCGTPLDSEWTDGFYTHYTELVMPGFPKELLS